MSEMLLLGESGDFTGGGPKSGSFLPFWGLYKNEKEVLEKFGNKNVLPSSQH